MAVTNEEKKALVEPKKDVVKALEEALRVLIKGEEIEEITLDTLPKER